VRLARFRWAYATFPKEYWTSVVQEVLKVQRETLGDRHPNTLNSINNLGLLLQEMGQLEKARPLLEEALQAGRETLGDRHRDTLISINNMGLLLKDMGQLEEARPLLEEALQAGREKLSDRHPRTLTQGEGDNELL
jgi:tetratricopeptide (TPR) repeat protein